jgi:hypothetical protein
MRVPRSKRRPLKRRLANDNVADLDAVAEAMERWTPAMIECREGRHLFTKRSPTSVDNNPAYRYIYEVRECERRCGVERHREIHPLTGVVINQWLNYTRAKERGYLLEPGTGRLDRLALGAVRLRMLEDEGKINNLTRAQGRKRPPSSAAMKRLANEEE